VGFHVGGQDAICQGYLQGHRAELTLASPLATRRLIHMPLSSGWNTPLDVKEVRETARSLAEEQTAK
jgi:hypothetical protein